MKRDIFLIIPEIGGIKMGRKFKSFNRQMIRRIATDYANSSLEYSRSYFCNRENITEYVFYRILHTAIERQIVDDDTAKRIARKSEKNSSKSVGGEGARLRSVQAYERSFEKRNTYVMSDSEVKEIAEAYAASLCNQAEFKKSMGLDNRLFNYAMKRAITEGIVDEQVVLAMRRKAEYNHGESATNFFDELETERQERIRGSRRRDESSAEQNKRKEHLKFMVETIESFCTPDEIEEYKDSMK